MSKVYGSQDPWSAGAFSVPEDPERGVSVYWVDGGTHNVQIAQLGLTQRESVLRELESWVDGPTNEAAIPDASDLGEKTPKISKIP